MVSIRQRATSSRYASRSLILGPSGVSTVWVASTHAEHAGDHASIHVLPWGQVLHGRQYSAGPIASRSATFPHRRHSGSLLDLRLRGIAESVLTQAGRSQRSVLGVQQNRGEHGGFVSRGPRAFALGRHEEKIERGP